MKLIDKSAVVAEIEARYNECLKRAKIIDAEYWNGKADAYRDMLVVLDTLEVKEVELEKELDSWRHSHFHGRRDKEASGEYLERVSQLNLAKYFFALGLKTQKGE